MFQISGTSTVNVEPLPYYDFKLILAQFFERIRWRYIARDLILMIYQMPEKTFQKFYDSVQA